MIDVSKARERLEKLGPVVESTLAAFDANPANNYTPDMAWQLVQVLTIARDALAEVEQLRSDVHQRDEWLQRAVSRYASLSLRLRLLLSGEEVP